MEKRALLAVVLSLLVLFLYQYIIEKSRKTPIDTRPPKSDIVLPDQKETIDFGQEEETFREVRDGKPFIKRQEIIGEERDISVITELYEAVFTNHGAKLKSWKLRKYKDKTGQDAHEIELIAAQKSKEYSLGLVLSKTDYLDLNEAVFETDSNSMSLMEAWEQGSISFSWTSPEGIEVIKKFTFYADRYLVDIDISIANLSDMRLKENTIFSWKRELDPKKGGDRFSFTGPVSLINGELEEIKVKKIKEDMLYSGEIKWAGYGDKYFISSIIPKKTQNTRLRISKSSTDVISVDIIEPIELNYGEKAKYGYSLYCGPKDIDILKAVGADLQKALNFGWFDMIAKPLLLFLKFINGITNNYGVAIILLTVVIKIVFFPLTHHSYKSMKDMQKVQPLMAKLKKKYKDDKEKLNREIMALYRTHKVNPLSGCLPMILQIPVFFALYKALMGSIELRHAPFIFWIKDLSAKDPSYITPVLMGASMFIQQKMTPTMGDPMQAKVMLAMPIIFTFMFLNFPSGLVIYWLVNNILSIGQQLYINKYTA
ncbi:MAG: membrane protein insertase YidC [Thermodesulfobacteriota bacterium]|nr:membrane protein insertase YidC [Thermodesulfobacteriota bacterium]